MKKLIITTIQLLLLLISGMKAQGGTAVPFVRIHPSPQLNGMAGAFSGLPTDNPFGMYFNPAQLGRFAKDNNFSTAFYLKNHRWLPQFNFSDLYFKSNAVNLGYSTDKLIHQVPVHLGLGFINSKLNLGKNIWTDEMGNELGVFESWEKYQQFGVGIGLDWKINFNFGLALKKITSNLTDIRIDSVSSGESKATTYDYGFLMVAPLSNFFKFPEFGHFFIFESIRPSLNFSFGLTVQNIGDKMRYIDSRQADPLPRTVHMGYGLSAGLQSCFKDLTLQLIKIDYASEAEDLLVNRRKDGSWYYVAFPGEINLVNHVLLGKYNNEIIIYQGYRFKLLEIFEYSYGYFRGAGFDPYIKTRGFLISSKGLFKALAAVTGNKILRKVFSDISIQYATSKYFSTDRSHPLNDTTFDGLIISLHGLF